MDEIGRANTAAGYLLVRRLGSGRRADVFLGHAPPGGVDGHAPPPALAATGSTARPLAAAPPAAAAAAAIKLFRPGTNPADIDAEIGALARASSPHLVRLHDLATAQDGLPILVLGLLRPQSLATLLAAHARLGSGEAVTILAPIAAAVAELHRVGVAHGAVTAGSVLFDELGTPVLASFGRARIIGEAPATGTATSLTPAELAASSPILRDLTDLATLAHAVLEATPESAGRRLALSFLLSADPSRAPERFAAELVGVLFDSAPATAVVLGTESSVDSRQHGPSRPRAAVRPRGSERSGGTSRVPGAPAAGIPGDDPDGPPVHPTRGRRRARPPWLDAIHLPEWLEQVVRSSTPSRSAGSGGRRMLAAVRRPVWVAAATAAVLLTAALMLVPSGDTSSGDPGAEADPPTSTADTVPKGPDAPAAPDTPDTPDTPPGVGTDEPTPDQPAITGDDPVAAAVALLERRDGCLASLSVLCLDAVDQAGSAAWEADGYLIREAQEGGGAAAWQGPPGGGWDGRTANLVERIGDSALVAVAAPGQPIGHPADHSTDQPTGHTGGTTAGGVAVSVLLIRGVEGWRIRDLFIG